jgi:hypothetical protein
VSSQTASPREAPIGNGAVGEFMQRTFDRRIEHTRFAKRIDDFMRALLKPPAITLFGMLPGISFRAAAFA